MKEFEQPNPVAENSPTEGGLKSQAVEKLRQEIKRRKADLDDTKLSDDFVLQSKLSWNGQDLAKDMIAQSEEQIRAIEAGELKPEYVLDPYAEANDRIVSVSDKKVGGTIGEILNSSKETESLKKEKEKEFVSRLANDLLRLRRLQLGDRVIFGPGVPSQDQVEVSQNLNKIRNEFEKEINNPIRLDELQKLSRRLFRLKYLTELVKNKRDLADVQEAPFSIDKADGSGAVKTLEGEVHDLYSQFLSLENNAKAEEETVSKSGDSPEPQVQSNDKANEGVIKDSEALAKVREELGIKDPNVEKLDSNNGVREQVKSEESKEHEIRIQKLCADMATSLSGIVRIIRNRKTDGFNELFHGTAAGSMSKVAESFQVLSQNPEGINDSAAENLTENIEVLIKSFDSQEALRENSLIDNRDSLRQLSTALNNFSEHVKRLGSETYNDRKDTPKFERLSPLLSGLQTNIENFKDLLNRRRVAIDKYLER